MAAQGDAAGFAALSICESVLIALVEKGVLGAEEARAVLEDAAAAHTRRETSGGAGALHRAAAQIIEQLATQIGAAGHGKGGGAGSKPP